MSNQAGELNPCQADGHPACVFMYSPGDNSANGFKSRIRCSVCPKQTLEYDASETDQAASDWNNWTNVS